MYDILSVFSVLYPHLSTTTVRQFSRVVLGLLAMTGAGQYAKYLTLDVSRRELPDDPTLFQHRYPLGTVYWVFFRTYLLDRESTYILAGDENNRVKIGSIDVWFIAFLLVSVW